MVEESLATGGTAAVISSPFFNEDGRLGTEMCS
jgi:hypothetical protein